MSDPRGPKSPDELGVHGRVEGVTRIGPRALLLGLVIAAVVVGGILFGLNSGKQNQSPQQTAAVLPTPLQAAQTAPPAFLNNVPVVETPPPETPPPAVLLPPSAPPLAQASPTAAAGTAPSTPSPAEVAEDKRLEEERQRELDEEKARQDELKRANQAPILLAGVGNGNSQWHVDA